MAFDAGLVERIAGLLEEAGARGALQRSFFGGRGFQLGRSIFAVAWRDGLLVKCAPMEYDHALAQPHVLPFTPDGTKAMSTWVAVDAVGLADDPELRAWLQRGVRGVRGRA